MLRQVEVVARVTGNAWKGDKCLLAGFGSADTYLGACLPESSEPSDLAVERFAETLRSGHPGTITYRSGWENLWLVAVLNLILLFFVWVGAGRNASLVRP